MSEQRIVIEHISSSQRIYHVKDQFNCKVEQEISIGQLEDYVKSRQPDSIESLMEALQDFESQHHGECSLGAVLNEIEYCDTTHNCKISTIEVKISLAFSNWSVIDKKIVSAIKGNMAWNKNAFVEISME